MYLFCILSSRETSMFKHLLCIWGCLAWIQGASCGPRVSSIDPGDICCGFMASGTTWDCPVWIRVSDMTLGYLAWTLGCPAQNEVSSMGFRVSLLG